MSLEMDSSQIPALMSWFNSFIGFAELQKRIERVEMKLNSNGFESPLLNRRFSFHITYKKMIIRSRVSRPIDIQNLEYNRAISFITALREASKKLSIKGVEQLRSRVREALGPDRDLRELEHEVRALVHYLQANCTVELADFDGKNRFDLLVSNQGCTFEVECKTFSETLGYPISINQSMVFFEAFKQSLERVPSFTESGIVK